MKKIISIISISFLILLASCSKTNNKNTTVATSTEIIENENPIITIHLSNEKTIRCELYPDVAPITVNNF